MPEAVMLRPNLSYKIRRAALRMARGETTPRANNVARHKLTVSYLVEKAPSRLTCDVRQPLTNTRSRRPIFVRRFSTQDAAEAMSMAPGEARQTQRRPPSISHSSAWLSTSSIRCQKI